MFAPERFRSQVKSLSGGERNRLLLARLFSRPANVLVLDEPTNDLDIETLELLEDLLVKYTGTVFLVSHDRIFLDNVVTQSLVFTGSGEIVEIIGGYSDYLAYQEKQQLAGKYSDKKSQNNLADKSPLSFPKEEKSRNKLSYKEKLELESLPQLLENLEGEQQQIQVALADGDLYKQELHMVDIYQNRLALIDKELIVKLARWEELEQKK